MLTTPLAAAVLFYHAPSVTTGHNDGALDSDHNPGCK